MAPWMMGYSEPRISVILFFIDSPIFAFESLYPLMKIQPGKVKVKKPCSTEAGMRMGVEESRHHPQPSRRRLSQRIS